MSTARRQNLRPVPSGNTTIATEAATSRPLEKRPNAPRSLSDIGQAYWRDYAEALLSAGILFESDLNTLEDLCRWECLKHRALDELPKASLYLEYRDPETEALTHTQPHAAFSNLKSIQQQVNSLRSRLGLSIKDRSGLKVSRRIRQVTGHLKSKEKNF